jgi:uncharacterized membrane protein
MHCGSFVVREVLDPLIGLYMDLHIIEASVLLGEFIGVAGISIHVSIRIGRTSVAESVHDLMDRFLV